MYAPIPGFQAFMKPVLVMASDFKEHSAREAIESVASAFQLTDDQRRALLPSGQQPVVDNRVQWALFHLRHAGLLESTRRGFFRLTARGAEVLQEAPLQIDLKLLQRYPEFVEFRTTRHARNGRIAVEQPEVTSDQTPEELLESGSQRIREDLSREILIRVRACAPSFFERLVVELLVAMGYGGSRKDAGEAVGRSGDEGIDGIIKEDRLGLDTIYIQAKRWQATVGRPEIQRFVGALHGQRARKGVFITTSDFSREAHDYVSSIESKVVLIDGEELALLMIDHNIGIARAAVYEIKRIDSDYFSEA